MATSGRAILQAHIDGLLPESLPFDFQWTLTGVIEIVPTNLPNGVSTAFPPTGTKLVVLVPPTTNSNVLTLKGIAGDTGVLLRPAEPNPIPWGGAPGGSFVINSAGTTNGCYFYYLG